MRSRLDTYFLFGSGDLSALSGFEVPFRSGPFEWLVLDLASSPPSLGVVFASPAVPLPHVPVVVALGLIGSALVVLSRRSCGRAGLGASRQASSHIDST